MKANVGIKKDSSSSLYPISAADWRRWSSWGTGNSISGHHLRGWFCSDSNAATGVLFQSEIRWKDRDTIEEWCRDGHKA
jgi:hypothetical protein